MSPEIKKNLLQSIPLILLLIVFIVVISLALTGKLSKEKFVEVNKNAKKKDYIDFINDYRDKVYPSWNKLLKYIHIRKKRKRYEDLYDKIKDINFNDKSRKQLQTIIEGILKCNRGFSSWFKIKRYMCYMNSMLLA